jgi:hypothetical protein
MTFILNKYIDDYIEKTKNDKDREIARHLKEIIPKTTHLDERIFKKVVNEFKKEMDGGGDFKNAFHKICKKFILTGDIITAELPCILTRIILNDSKFMEMISKGRSISLSRRNIKRIVDSGNRRRIIKLLKDLTLSVRKTVFATFNENDPEADPFENYGLDDVISMLALDRRSIFKENKPSTSVVIRYRNEDYFLKKFPVFPDAGWYDKFFPSRDADKYGRTKSLDPELKNMPEIVHENLRLADVIEKIRFLKE